ncbi:MAG: septum site-determining protein MinD [Chloroflexota bacterium]|nr:septum site-determining protein MinD [Chloroflexota bacterium]
MSARIITITSGKGGVGKTIATANISVGLALKGKRVVAVDTDIGLRNLDMAMGLENRIIYNIVDVVEGRCQLPTALVRDKRLKGLYLLPAAQTRDKSALSSADMVRVCDQMRDDFDFVLIDSPAGIEQGFRNALAPADEVFIITTPEVASVRDADRVIGLVEAEGRESVSLIINRLDPRIVRRGDMLSTDDVIEILAISLVGIVPEDEAIIVSVNRGIPIALDNSSSSGQAFRNIADRLLGEDVPFMDIEVPGFIERFARFLRR